MACWAVSHNAHTHMPFSCTDGCTGTIDNSSIYLVAAISGSGCQMAACSLRHLSPPHLIHLPFGSSLRPAVPLCHCIPQSSCRYLHSFFVVSSWLTIQITFSSIQRHYLVFDWLDGHSATQHPVHATAVCRCLELA